MSIANTQDPVRDLALHGGGFVTGSMYTHCKLFEQARSAGVEGL